MSTSREPAAGRAGPPRASTRRCEHQHGGRRPGHGHAGALRRPVGRGGKPVSGRGGEAQDPHRLLREAVGGLGHGDELGRRVRAALMASVPHRLGEERATVPRIVLPITSRGLVVTDRLCWGILGAAMAVAAGLILYLNRGTTFFVDEIGFLYSSPRLDASYVLE